MNNPFKVGDTVYHVVQGECEVVGKGFSELPFYLKPKNGGGNFWTGVCYLSFKPWPAPCLERPFEPVLKRGDKVFAEYRGVTSHSFRTEVVDETEEHVCIPNGVKLLKSGYNFYRITNPVKFN